MPKVKISELEERKDFFQKSVKSRMVLTGMKVDRIVKLVGTSNATHSRRVNSTAELDKMPLWELIRYCKVLDIPDEVLIYLIKGGVKPC